MKASGELRMMTTPGQLVKYNTAEIAIFIHELHKGMFLHLKKSCEFCD